MGVRVGITRSLLFYHYYPLWKSFFQGLGAEVILSPPTTQGILERGIRMGVADLCLPMKLHLGHVETLKGKVDFLFIPRLVSFSADTYLCPKFLGLPDFVKAAIEDLPPLLAPCFNAKVAGRAINEGFWEVGRLLGESEKRIQAALREAEGIQARFEGLLREGWLPLAAMEAIFAEASEEAKDRMAPQDGRPLLAIVGHPYNLYDEYLNFNILNQIKGWGYDLLTPEMVSQEEVEERNAILRKKIYWSLTRRIVGAALSFLSSGRIQGMIFLSSFGCGPDSFSKDLLDRRVKAFYPLPYLCLIFDEHTSETGLQTRLDAFLDMVQARRKRIGSNLFPPERSFLPMANLPSLKITVPHMGRIDLAYARVLQDRGVTVIVPPRPNARSLELGSRVSPEFACLPFKLNMGNMIEALEMGANTILTYGGCGPCRFGYYSCLQEEILKDLGYQFAMGTTDDPDRISSTIATIAEITGIESRWEGFQIFYLMMKRLSAADEARKLSHKVRPREREKGAASEVYQQALDLIEASLTLRQLRRERRKIRRMFSSIPLAPGDLPLVKIGIVGELFMVEEPNANFEVEKKLGELGAYVERGIWLSEWLNERFHFEPWKRARTRRAEKLARGYLEHSAGGESLISVGGAIDFARRRFDGVVHVMPFTCMPEIVAQGVLNRVSREFSFPILTLIIDEHTAEAGVNTRLEAFVDLLQTRKRRNRAEGLRRLAP